jgi:uncharacterized protein (DUF2147 family)
VTCFSLSVSSARSASNSASPEAASLVFAAAASSAAGAAASARIDIVRRKARATGRARMPLAALSRRAPVYVGRCVAKEDIMWAAGEVYFGARGLCC